MANLAEEEIKAYEKLTLLVGDVEASQNRELGSVLESEEYRSLLAGWFGCEVISLYVTSDEDAVYQHSGRKQIEFLYESTPGALDFPMYTINPGTSETHPYSGISRVNDQTRDERRKAQKRLLRSKNEQTSAEFCAKHLQKENAPAFLLLSFGEILSYCYAYQVINHIQQITAESDWESAGERAWEALVFEYQKRSGINKTTVPSEILKAVHTWYFSDHKDPSYGRSYLGANKIQAIYELPEDIKTLLDECVSSNEVKKEFLKNWAMALCKPLVQEVGNTESIEKLKTSFYEKTLINPEIEMFLCTRGLYITIIRSLLNRNTTSSVSSKAYVICTVYNASWFKNPMRRRNLNHVVRRLSYDEIAGYDYHKLKDASQNEGLIQQFVKDVASSNNSWYDLLQEAGRLSASVYNTKHVLISLKDIGTFLLIDDLEKELESTDRQRDNKQAYKYVWRDHFSEATFLCNSDKFLGLLELAEKNKLNLSQLDSFKKSTSKKLHIPSYADMAILHSKIEDENSKYLGVIVLFMESSLTGTTRNKNYILQIATALAIGRSLPFRNMVDRGGLSILFTFLVRLFTLNWNFTRKRIKTTIGPTSILKRIFDFLLATMLEFAQFGFIIVGIVFLFSVFKLINVFGNPDITKVLKSIEKTVMAFSICLAATGIIFLMRPDSALSQPKWMKKFAKPGTLEQTLVKLAAMVLTIDVLNVVLRLQDFVQSSNTYLWILVKPAMFHLIAYLVVLLGLAFLSEFLLNESEKKKNRPGSHVIKASENDAD